MPARPRRSSPAAPARSADKVLKVVLAVDMRGIDPVFNTAAYAANHGYLVYDQLFALDSRGKPQPQMVDNLGGVAPTARPGSSACAVA